ncbi:leukocyte elastase inhibitor-like [Pollicipes pollicipes]|uniref:leukocyte elastase inhibitor-like n=1 Tax=Pollicipes pollicipes TaxID=41117 RepID=UPI001884C074|nr:leukocyte elastase inhibitor-like [Pollicipes pollicipes]
MKLFGLFAVILATSEAALGKPQKVVSRPSKLAPPVFSITDPLVNFTVDMSTNYLAPGNTVLSPFSIVSVMNLLLLGASDRTYEQLRKTLKYPPDFPDLIIHQHSGIELNALTAGTPGVTVNIANRIFADERFPIVPQYRRDAQDFYQASIETVSFGGRPSEATRLVNEWVYNNTNGKIAQLLVDPLPSLTRMVAANVVYFNSSWKTPFKPEHTAARPFNVSASEVVMTDVMMSSMEVPYAAFHGDKFSVVGLPYEGDRHSMYVFLPDEVGEAALERLERHIGEVSLDSIIDALRLTYLPVALPRFKMSHTLALSGVLRRMGAIDLFSQRRASLRRLSPDNQLFLSEVLHQTVIDVHERGTEAAAATVSFASRFGISPNFAATRPFLFVIRDNKTGVPLFWGRLIRPDPSTL